MTEVKFNPFNISVFLPRQTKFCQKFPIETKKVDIHCNVSDSIERVYTCWSLSLVSLSIPYCPWSHGGCGQKSFKPVWRCHQLLSGFLAKGHLPRMSRQSRRSLMIRAYLLSISFINMDLLFVISILNIFFPSFDNKLKFKKLIFLCKSHIIHHQQFVNVQRYNFGISEY